MSGPVLMVVTAVVLLGAAFLLAYIPSIFSWFVGVFKRRGPLGKILLLLPLIVLGVLSSFSLVIIAALGLFAVIWGATAVRDWWQKGK